MNGRRNENKRKALIGGEWMSEWMGEYMGEWMANG